MFLLTVLIVRGTVFNVKFDAYRLKLLIHWLTVKISGGSGEGMYEDRVESNASFIALPSDQLFDEVQPSTSQKKRRRIAPQLPSDDDNNS